MSRLNPLGARRHLCLATALLLLLLAGVVAAAGAAPGETLHPRIFFQAKDLVSGPDLRGRVAITGSHCEEYALLCQWAEAQLPRPAAQIASDSDLCQESALTYALLYQLSGDGRYGDRAVALIRALITSKEGRLPGFDWPDLPATVATVFDWTYDRLSPEDRARLLYDILKRGIYVRDRKTPAELQPHAPKGRPLEGLDPAPYLKPLAFASLVLAGEPEAADYAPQWQEFSAKVLAEQLATLDGMGSDGAWLPRTGGLDRELDVLEVLEAWRTAAGELPVPHPQGGPQLPSHFRNLSRRILCRLRPGLILPGLAGDPPDPTARTSVPGPPEPIPPSLLYLLANHEDDPNGRWLAETVRLANAPPAGSAEWLSDLRARILWLTKGTPRLSPEEAGLPLAASFADTGEVVVRSDWDFTRPESTWLLFRVSPRDPSPFACWNHLALVRGSDALAVETNIVGAGDTPYAQNWFGTALAQNSVFGASGRLPAEAECVLDACTVGAGFAYLRGRVGRPGGGQPAPKAGVSGVAPGPFGFTREVVAFHDGLAVVRDRVRGLANPVWVLHVLDEPKLNGRARSLAGTSEGGVRESTDSTSVLWETGQSRGYLAVLLPRDRRVRTIGGNGYEFWSPPGLTASENLWPTMLGADGTAVPYSPDALRRAEVGTWRVEIEPGTQALASAVAPPGKQASEGAAERQGTPGALTEFLTVLSAGGRDSGEPQASVEAGAQAAGAGGVEVRVTWQGRLYRVTLEDEGTGSVAVTEAGSGKVLVEGKYPTGRDESR